MIDTSTLNKNQLKAVFWDSGPLLVLACPKSGKTNVLTLRIARLLAESPDQFFKILALTSTTNSATKMRERIHNQIPNMVNRTRPTTFHSFASNLLRQHGHHIGLQSNFTTIDQE